jgi:hypothetical protein
MFSIFRCVQVTRFSCPFFFSVNTKELVDSGELDDTKELVDDEDDSESDRCSGGLDGESVGLGSGSVGLDSGLGCTLDLDLDLGFAMFPLHTAV